MSVEAPSGGPPKPGSRPGPRSGQNPGQGPGAGSAAGVIHDLGYRGYEGPRLGRGRIVAALTWHSFRAAFGFGRGAKAKIVPVVAFIGLCLPAVVNAFAMSRGQARIVTYDTYVPVLRVLVMTVFVAVQAPELVSRDLRSRVLPLYFSRPIRSGDYPLAKYLAFSAACLVMMEVPLLLLYAGSIVNVHGGSAVWAQTKALIPGLLVGLMWAVVLAGISLFIASLTGRRAFATGAVAIFFLLTFTLSEILLQVENNAAINQGPVPVQNCPPNCSPPAPPPPSLAEKVSGLFSPFTLMDGVRRWLGGITPALNVQKPGSFGAVYGLVLIVILALCLAGLAARYRKARLS
jgi:ABC-2 type transport system permease protein